MLAGALLVGGMVVHSSAKTLAGLSQVGSCLVCLTVSLFVCLSVCLQGLEGTFI